MLFSYTLAFMRFRFVAVHWKSAIWKSGSHSDFNLSSKMNSIPYYIRLLSILVSTQSSLFFLSSFTTPNGTDTYLGLVYYNREQLLQFSVVVCVCKSSFGFLYFALVFRSYVFLLFHFNFSFDRFVVLRLFSSVSAISLFWPRTLTSSHTYTTCTSINNVVLFMSLH